MKMFKF